MTQEQMHAMILKLQAENDALKRKAVNTGSRLKISEKGALSLYGLGRWPVTLYKSQWQALLAMAPEIKSFIEAHGDRLKEKTDGTELPAVV